MRQKSAIVLVVLSWGGLTTGKLLRVDLVSLDEELRWLSKIPEINYSTLVHLLDLVDASLEF